jgi:Ca-activated chloride channel homolog
MKKRSLILTLLLLSIITISFGQGTLKGKVTDGKDSLPYVNIAVFKGTRLIAGENSGNSGRYVVKKIPTGLYEIHVSSVGYSKVIIKEVKIKKDSITKLDIVLQKSITELEMVDVVWDRPLIVMSSSMCGSNVTSQSINRVASRSAQRKKRKNTSTYKNRSVKGFSVRRKEKKSPVNLKKPEVKSNKSSNGSSFIFQSDSLCYQQIVPKQISSHDIQDTNAIYVFNDYYLKNHDLMSEEYDAIIENEFVGTMKTPLSTFSVDVDKASYSNMRRFFTQNQRPPVNSVRIEELVNYFNYDYPQPANNDAFSINTEYVNCPWNKKNKLLLVGIQGKKIPIDKVPATNMIFLIDVSGSMSDENKLPLVKKSLIMLVEQMRSIDKIGIAVYAGESGIALESTFCTPENKDKIISSIASLQSGGSTAGASGINLAYNMAAENFIKDGNNRIVLCTDGDFNVGVSDDGELVKLIEEKRKGGVFLSILGYGMGNYKDAKIEKLADKGNGNYAYIDDVNEAKRVLVEQFSATIMTIAKDVKIQIKFNPKNVKEYRLIGYENRALAAEDFDNDAVDAGEVGSGASVTALYEIVPADTLQTEYSINKNGASSVDLNANNLLCNLKIRYKAPAGIASKLIEKPIDNRCSAFENGTNNIRFAASVASFGMLIRFSKFVGMATFESVYKYAKGSANGSAERQEFLEIVKQAHDMYVK